MTRGWLVVFALAGVPVVACDDGPAESSGFVQITAFDVGASGIDCGAGPTPSPDSLYWYVRIVNTTRDTVDVTGVGSAGVIVRSSNAAIVGRNAAMFSTLPYTPLPAVLIPRLGDVQLVVRMPTAPLCIADAPATKDIDTSIRVRTSTGEYATTPRVLIVR